MPTARPRLLSRNAAVLAGSLAVHAALLAFLAFPRIEAFVDRSNDEDALTVTLERREPAMRAVTPARAAPPVSGPTAPPRMQPRTPRALLPTGVPPLTVAPTIGTAPHPAPLPASPRGDLRSALRGGGVGCANRDRVGLTRREEEACDERLGAMARNAPVYGNAPLSVKAGQDFARQAARQEADRRYRASPMAPGVDHRSRDGLGQMKEIPFVLGDTDGLGRKKSDASMGIKRGN